MRKYYSDRELIAFANYGDYYKLVEILNTTGDETFKAFPDYVYDLVIDGIMRGQSHKSNDAIWSVLNVLSEKTKPYQSQMTKSRLSLLLERFSSKECA